MAPSRPAMSLFEAYKVLQINGSATDAEIRKAFLKGSPRTHPDKTGDPNSAAAFRAIKEAYDVLNNRAARATSRPTPGKPRKSDTERRQDKQRRREKREQKRQEEQRRKEAREREETEKREQAERRRKRAQAHAERVERQFQEDLKRDRRDEKARKRQWKEFDERFRQEEEAQQQY